MTLRFAGAALVLALAAVAADSCGNDESATVLTVFADVSLSEAFEEIGKAFEEANPDVEVRFEFAGANELASRLAEGATADVVAMAGEDTFQRLIDSGLAQAATEITSNTLAVTTGEGVEGIDSLEDLANDGVRVAMAAAESPEGQLARKMLALAAADYGEGWEAAVLANVIAGDITVRDVLERVESGDAEAGFVYRSDLTAVTEAAALGLLPLPARLALGIVYPASLTAAPPELVLAQAFVSFLLSEDAQAIFDSFGFGNNQ